MPAPFKPTNQMSVMSTDRKDVISFQCSSFIVKIPCSCIEAAASQLLAGSCSWSSFIVIPIVIIIIMIVIIIILIICGSFAFDSRTWCVFEESLSFSGVCL